MGMSDTAAKAGTESRRSPRVELSDLVAIDLQTATVTGSGNNISEEGVYFTADQSIPVRVRIGEGGVEVQGDLARVEAIGDGTFGIAVRFREPHPGLVPAT